MNSAQSVHILSSIYRRVADHIGMYGTLLEIAKTKVRWFGHVVRSKGTLRNTILQGRVEGERSRGRPARQWLDDVKEWTGLSLDETWREPEDRVAWRNRDSRVAPNGLSSLWD